MGENGEQKKKIVLNKKEKDEKRGGTDDKKRVTLKKKELGKKIEPTESSMEHWIIYSLGTFISVLVVLEFVLAQIFFTQFSPSSFTYHLTPFYLFWGNTSPTLFFSTLLVFLFYITLSQKVYVKGKDGLTFRSVNSCLLLPFYLIMIGSLGYFILIAPLKLSNSLTYILFLLVAESMYEYSQVADLSKLSKSLKRLVGKIEE